jgi:hypothetical protein
MRLFQNSVSFDRLSPTAGLLVLAVSQAKAGLKQGFSLAKLCFLEVRVRRILFEKLLRITFRLFTMFWPPE